MLIPYSSVPTMSESLFLSRPKKQTLKKRMKPVTKNSPIEMEAYFSPGFKTKPAVHVGSQSLRMYLGDKLEQAIEGMHLAGASEGDVAIVRDMDPLYIEYWKKLMGDVHVINLKKANQKEYLSNVILRNPDIIKEIQENMHPNASLMVYLPTHLETKVAKKIGISLHGAPSVSTIFGTKTGIRELAQEENIPMAEGYICTNSREVKKAMKGLFETYDAIIIKHTLSSAGRWMKKIKKGDKVNVTLLLNEVSGGEFVAGRDHFVVEAWIKSKASLCAQIEIREGEDPVIAAAWQQMIDTDGITYMGAIPLTLSPRVMKSFLKEVNKLAWGLKRRGAVGSYGPDFLITSKEDDQYPENTTLLLELNARVPVTAFSLEVIKQVKGKIGSGFLTQNIKLKKKMTFSDIKEILERENLLITSKGAQSGIVPYNIKLLDWNTLYYVVMADTWKEASSIAERARQLFEI